MINHRQEKGVQGILLKTSLSTLAAVAVILPVSAASGLPEVKPVFKPTAGKLVKPELKLMEVSKGVNPIFVCGNKRVAVREHNDWRQKVVYDFKHPEQFSVIIDNIQRMRGYFVGNVPELKNYGHPFDNKEKGNISYDVKSKSVIFTKKYHYAKDKTATYRHTLQILKNGQIKVSWNLGIDKKTLDSFGRFKFWFVPKFYIDYSYLKLGIDINGKPVKFLSDAEFAKTGKGGKPVKIASGKGGTVTMAPKDPLLGFKLIFDKNQPIEIIEGFGKYVRGKHSLLINIGNHRESPTGSFLIDLGQSATMPEDTPEPVRGTDLWEVDRSHIPLSPIDNIVPNPSFEQGMRYWRSFSLGGNFHSLQNQDKPLYEISSDAKFGKNSLKINSGAVPVNSFSIPVIKGKTYTVSFYAKSLKPTQKKLYFTAGSSIQTGDWLKAKRRWFELKDKWQRYSFQYKATSKAICLILRSGAPTLVDGIQVEQNNKATAFIAPPVEGDLLTSDKDDFIHAGKSIDARFKLFGKPGTTGNLKLDVYNYYREKVYSDSASIKLGKDGSQIIPLKLEESKTGKGVFIVKATYEIKGFDKYFDYYRFAVIDALNNTHATKNLFGTNMRSTRLTRSEDVARRFAECGWGSVGSADLPVEYYKKFNITQFYRLIQRKYSVHWTKPPYPWYGIWKSWDGWTPERDKEVEELVYQAVKKFPKTDHTETAVAGEITHKQKMVMAGKYKDYVKLMMAARRGAKRACKDIVFLPDQGTSGFKPIRGYRETEAILKATPKGYTWDALAAHPYGDVDMIDERTVFFKEIAKKYGQDKVPLQYTECFNIADHYIPSWGADGWMDKYWNGRPTYDTGWAEFRQAAWASRIYLVCLKHWPRMEHVNIWINNPFVDTNLQPLMLCAAVNTLGHLFANPKYFGEVRPVEGIRSYIFEDDKNRGLAAVWSTITEVDRGYEAAPKLQLKFSGKMPEVIDLMGNKRNFDSKNGEMILPLSPAPIFLRGGAPAAMKKAFENALVIGSNRAVKTVILPTIDGEIEATVSNQTSQALSGNVSVDGKAQSFKLNKAPDQVKLALKKAGDCKPGVMYEWDKTVKIDMSNGGMTEDKAGLKYFYAPYTSKPLPLDPESPDWKKIPSIALTNVYINKRKGSKHDENTGKGNDCFASYQAAWDKDNLYLKVTMVDDTLLGSSEKWLEVPKPRRNKILYLNDGSLEVYIDTAADGRSNSRKWYDDDDYRYDFYGNGSEGIYRRQEVNQQLAGGVGFLTKEKAAKTIRNKFVTKGNTCSYVIIFPQITIEPMRLKAGFRAGFGVYIHDFDKHDYHGLSNSTEAGAHCNRRPDLWPIIVLSK